MKCWKIPLLLIALLLYAPSAFAFLDCDAVNESVRDTLRIPRTKGKPGDTVWVPFYCKMDSLTGGFKSIVRYDKDKLTPAFLPVDPLAPTDTFVNFQVSGQFKKVYDSLNLFYPAEMSSGALAPFVVQVSQNSFDSGGLVCFFQYIPPDAGQVGAKPYQYMQPGSSTIFRLAFIMNAGMPHNDSTRMIFHEVNEVYVVGGVSVFADCRRTDFASAWRDAVGQVISTTTLFPTVIDGYIVADTAPLPVINTFDATPSTITSGSSSTLSWDVTNMDSLRVTGGSTSVGSTSPNSFTIVTPTATTTYTLTAWKGAGNITAQASVTVTTGGGGGGTNTAPVITLNPPGNSYTIDQLQTVSFTVSATDANGDPITLSASQLPANATFATATGTGSASSPFTFTPSLSQTGQFTVIFNVSDNKGGSSSAAVAINVNELQDQLFSSSKLGGRPVGGLSGKKEILFPVNFISKQTVYGVQFDMMYDHTLFIVDSFITTPRTDGFVIYDLETTPGTRRVIVLDLANDTIKAPVGDSTAIMYAVMSIDSSATPGNYPIYFENGWESLDPDPLIPAFQLVTDSGIIQVDRPGDVNLDGSVNVADPVSVIGYIIGNVTLRPRNFATADVITNDTVDVFDLVGIINLALGGTLSPVAGQPFGDEPATIAFAYGDLSAGGSDVLTITSEMPTSVAGVQLSVTYDPSTMIVGVPKLAEDARKLRLIYNDDGRGRILLLMYYGGNSSTLLPSGASDLVEIPFTAIRDIRQEERKPISLRSAKVSTKESQIVLVSGVSPSLPSSFTLQQNYPNPFNPTTMIEFNINVSDDDIANKNVTLDIFNLLGQRVTRLYDGKRMPGLYRIEWDGSNGDGSKVSSGVYFYRLMVGDESQTKKMVLVK